MMATATYLLERFFCQNRLAYVFILCSSLVHSQNWEEVSSYAGIERDDAVGFSIGDEGFVGTGRDIGFQYRTDFYRYKQGVWDSISPIIGPPRQYCSSFSFYSRGCIVNGISDNGDHLNELQCYSSLTATWEIKSSFPGLPRQQSISFQIGEMGYCGMGRNTIETFRDWYCYNNVTDIWTMIPDYPDDRYECVSFVIDGAAYVGLGADLDGNMFNTFYRYSPVTNDWREVAPFPGDIRTYSIGFMLNGKGYVCTGLDGNSQFSDQVWQYDSNSDSWKQLSDFPYEKVRGVSKFSVNGCTYLVAGLNESMDRLNNSYELCEVENGVSYHVNFHPNISTGIYTFTSNEEENRIMIYNSIGEVVYDKWFYGYTGVLNISENPIGMYFVKVQNQLGYSTLTRIIIS